MEKESKQNKRSEKVFELHEVYCLDCGEPIPCCFFYCIKCEIKQVEKLEIYKSKQNKSEKNIL